MKTRISSLIPVESISTRIFLIRGEKVLLDRDLANLYGVETKVLNQAVNRNISRFPADFMFRLTKEENDFLRSQIVTLKKGEHSKYLPAAFTEQGVAMLSSVLKGERAVQVNIAIMRAFVQMRKFFESNQALAKKLSTLEAETKKKFAKQHDQIALIFEAIKELMIEKEKPKRRIGY